MCQYSSKIFTIMWNFYCRSQEIQDKMEVIESDSKVIWGEMSRLRTRHDLQQQTINRVLYFLTSVYAPDRIEQPSQVPLVCS